MTDLPAREWVTVARLVRPQGRHGEILAEILTDFPERFAERRRLYLRSPSAAEQDAPREVALELHWLHQGRLVLKFSDVETIEAADALRGFDVLIPLSERAPLEAGAVYIRDLLGCLLYDRRTSQAAGEIVDVDRDSANMELLVVRASGARRAELLIPFANAYEPVIDLAARRMEMTLPEGLLTLDSPDTEEEGRAAEAGSGGSS